MQYQLGHLKVIEIYEYYDKPLLFACQNTAGQIFLAVLIDETEEKEVWYYVPVSPLRFEQIRAGKVDLHDAFLRAEDEQVFKIITPQSHNSDVTIEYVPTNELSDDDLPLAGEILNLDTQTLPSAPPAVRKAYNMVRRHAVRVLDKLQRM